MRHPFKWRELNGFAQLALHDGRVVGVAYAVPADRNAFEFWWRPVHEPDCEEVLFGWPAAADGSVVLWDGVHQSAQRIEAENDAATGR
jgi:hypothetical protein